MKLPETSMGKLLGLDDESSYIKVPTKYKTQRVEKNSPLRPGSLGPSNRRQGPTLLLTRQGVESIQHSLSDDKEICLDNFKVTLFLT